MKFQHLFRGSLGLLVVFWAWALWAAVVATNSPSGTTNQTSSLVQGVERLSEHPLTFKLDEVAFLRDYTFLGEPLWKYVASLIYVLLAFYAAKLIDLVTNVWLKRLTSRTETKFDDLLLELLRGPIKVVLFVVLLNIGLNFFEWPSRARLYMSKGLILVVAASLTFVAIKVVDILLGAWKRRHAHESDRRFNDQLFSVIRVSVNVFVIMVAVMVTAQNMNINITAAIASLSIGGLAVGLAAQDTLANLFGALAVFVDKPFRVGDQIKVDSAEGKVEAVGLRSTRLRSAEGHLVAVPNKTIGNATITNITQRPGIKTVINLVLSRDLPAAKIRRAIALLEEIYRGHRTTREAWISFNQFAGANVNIQIVHWWNGTDYQAYLAGMQEMNLAVKEKFEAEGITLV
ncbi:MAG TPA: mechanosensitive ion channel domain-containing protein [Candidatus Limnocylindrales bacterium]|nr:mechanosensitive ion channel domain-containing protein [Candidatus Limnocylindrales bacterium]